MLLLFTLQLMYCVVSRGFGQAASCCYKPSIIASIVHSLLEMLIFLVWFRNLSQAVNTPRSRDSDRSFNWLKSFIVNDDFKHRRSV